MTSECLSCQRKFRESFHNIQRTLPVVRTFSKYCEICHKISLTSLRLQCSLLILETLVYLESSGHEPEQLQVSELPQGGGRVWGRVKISSAHCVKMATPTSGEGSVVGLELCLECGGHRVQVDEGDGEGGPAHDQGHQAVGGGVDGGQLEEACTVLL